MGKVKLSDGREVENTITLPNGKTITMRPPKVSDLRAVSSIVDDVERDIAIFANLTGMTEDEIGELDIIDYRKLEKIYLDFTLPR